MPAILAREALITTSQERHQAAELITGSTAPGVTISAEHHSDHPIPAELAVLLRKILEAIAAGRTVTVGTMPEELTTSAAADMLGMSRPTLMKLIRSDELAAHKVGTHTRVRTADVLAFQRKRLEGQRRAFEELRVLEDELGLE